MDFGKMEDANVSQNGSSQNDGSSFGNNNNNNNNNGSQQSQSGQAMDVSGSNQQNGSNGQNDPNNQGQKRQAEFDSNQNANNKGQQKRMRTDNYNQNKNGSFPNRAGKVDLRILLPSKDAGAIIGRGGANIKKLRSEHKTIIQVPDCDGPERLLLIGGDTEAAISTILDIIPLLEENQKFGNNEHPTEFRLLVHQSQAGCIIGRSGDKIKELRQSHNLDMKVYSECAPMSTERIAQMRGKPQDIVNCLREVLTLLESAPPKGMNRPYDPHNYNEFLSSQYGGYTSDKRNNMGGGRNNQGGGGGAGGNFNNNQGGGNMNRNGPRGGGGGGNQGGFFGNNNNMNDRRGGNMGGGNRGGNMGGGNQNNNMGNRGPGGMNNRGGNMGGGNMGGNMGGGNMGGDRRSNSAGGGPGGNRGGPMGNQGNRPGMGNQGNRGNFGNRPNNQGGGNQGGFNNGGMNNQQSFNNNQNNQANAITNQVTIPNDLAGAIIGPKGSKIAQIREQSGAGITIDKPTPGSNDRIITITGSAEQIQNAQYLLQMTVKQSGLWQGN